MTDQLIVVGPIEIPFTKDHKAKYIQKDNISEFWTNPLAESIAEKQGCYVFATQAGRGFTPWYIGKTSGPMKKECFTDHKRGKYNDFLFQGRKGTPVMYFLVPEGTKKKVPKSILDELESVLIQQAVLKNPDLTNDKKTKTPQWAVKGVIRSGKGAPTTEARDFATMMGLR